MNITYPLPMYVQRFFTERLLNQMRASPNTIASYRDTFRLLLNFAKEQTGLNPTEMEVAHIDAELVGRFLVFCEEDRGISPRSRNTRLAAIRSFFKYIAINEPQLLHHCQRILAIPSKRYDKHPIDFLHHDEAEALINAPDQASWYGRRDRTLLLVMLQTGLRVTELIELHNDDVELGTGAHVRCFGKGRKARATPLRKDSVQALTQWQRDHDCRPDMPLFPSNRGTALSRDAVERLVRKHALGAVAHCASLGNKHVTPHVLRHTAAMQLRQSGVDTTIIALWLGHESVESTLIYVHADLQMKEKAMARTDPTNSKAVRYRPDDQLLEFLEGL